MEVLSGNPLLPVFPGKRGHMRHAVDMDRFLATESSQSEEIEEQRPASTNKWKEAILITLEIAGLIILSSFGTWPAVAFLCYMAITT